MWDLEKLKGFLGSRWVGAEVYRRGGGRMGECAPRKGGRGQSSCPKFQDPTIFLARSSALCIRVAVPRLASLTYFICSCLRGAVYPLPGCTPGAGGDFGTHAGQRSHQRYLSTSLLGEVCGWAGLLWAQTRSAPCLYLYPGGTCLLLWD